MAFVTRPIITIAGLFIFTVVYSHDTLRLVPFGVLLTIGSEVARVSVSFIYTFGYWTSISVAARGAQGTVTNSHQTHEKIGRLEAALL